MHPATRFTLILTLAMMAGFALYAQETTAGGGSTTTATTNTATSATTTSTAAGESPAHSIESRTSRETYQDFARLLQEHPPEVGTILALDPTLLSNDAFLEGYPELQAFVRTHPEVRRNPRYFLAAWQEGSGSRIDDILGGLFGFSIFLTVVLALGWLVRTIVEQKRWTRLSRTQTEVHNKILDRFGTSNELIEYMQTPAGTKFLESAPIPLREAPVAQNVPAARVLWSIQLGIIIAAGAVGLLAVAGRFDKESAQALSAMGMIALCVGIGFIVSAAVSLFVSRRLGLWRAPEEPQESGLVR
jgi:hypothetical protein